MIFGREQMDKDKADLEDENEDIDAIAQAERAEQISKMGALDQLRLWQQFETESGETEDDG